MKTKQEHIKAVFTASNSNAKNMDGEKEQIAAYKIIDKKTERTVVDCRVYMGRSSSATTVYASIWAYIKENKVAAKYKPAFMVEHSSGAYFSGCTSGHGWAGGYGYCKESQAIGDAIKSAGIELYGSAYPSYKDSDKKRRAYIGGTGCHEKALLAIAYAGGYTDCILVKA